MYSRICYIKTASIAEVKSWAESRGGQPAVIKDTDILHIKLPENSEYEQDLEAIDWSQFAALFKKHHCLFLYEDDLHSSFYKLIENCDS